MKALSSAVLLGWGILALTGCRPPAVSPWPKDDTGKLKVVTSFLPAYCFTSKICGDLAWVMNLLPENANPHDFQFKPSDIKLLQEADVLVVNGLGLESWLVKAVDRAGLSKSLTIIEMSEGIPDLIESASSSTSSSSTDSHDHSHNPSHDHGHHHGPVNPHIWLDPLLAQSAVSNIWSGLLPKLPSHAEPLQEQALAFIDELASLHEEISTQLAPLSDARLVTLHDAFAYFARRYNLTIIGVIEPAADISPSPKYLTQLLGKIRSEKVRAIFSETGTPSGVAQRISTDLALPLGVLNTLEFGVLSPDTYRAGMLENANELRRLLMAPE